MLIPPRAWSALLEAGVRVRPLTSSSVELSSSLGGEAVTAAAQRRNAALTLNQLRDMPKPPEGHLFLVVNAASAVTLAAARSAGISVLAGDDRGFHGHVVLPGQIITVGSSRADTSTNSAKRRGRPPWGSFTIARLLLDGGAHTQAELSKQAGVSQPRVSQTLSQLQATGLVTKANLPSANRWRTADWDALADWFLARYPGPGGITTYWYGLDSPRDQSVAALNELTKAGVPVAVSGDVAADQLAPWRRPVRSVLYVDPGRLGAWDGLLRTELVPTGESEATLELTVPADPGVWVNSQQHRQSPLPIVNTMQVLWDVQRSPGTDTDQAMEKLRAKIRFHAEMQESW